MDILVDFDNIKRQHKRAGLLPLTTLLIERVLQSGAAAPRRARIRLYGGWYDLRAPTKQAQQLSAEIPLTFPTAVRAPLTPAPPAVAVSLELAYSLEAEPMKHLLHTFRTRPFAGRIGCDTNALNACLTRPCPLFTVESFLRTQRCPETTCRTMQKDILTKSEQKLIDTMLVSDLIFLSTRGASPLVVVSSDDDIWPGIRTALALGASIIHVHTSHSHSTAKTYLSAPSSAYIETRL